MNTNIFKLLTNKESSCKEFRKVNIISFGKKSLFDQLTFDFSFLAENVNEKTIIDFINYLVKKWKIIKGAENIILCELHVMRNNIEWNKQTNDITHVITFCINIISKSTKDFDYEFEFKLLNSKTPLIIKGQWNKKKPSQYWIK